VQTRRLEIVGPMGNIVGVFDADNDGARIIMQKNKSTGGIALFTNENGGAIGVRDNDGRVVVRAGVSPKGGLLAITNQSERLIFVAAAGDSSDGAAAIYDRNGHESWAVPSP